MGVVDVEFLLIVIRQGEFEVSQKAGWNEEEAGTSTLPISTPKRILRRERRNANEGLWVREGRLPHS